MNLQISLQKIRLLCPDIGNRTNIGIVGLVLAMVFYSCMALDAEAVEVWGVDVVRYGIYTAKVQQMEDIEKSPGGKRHVVMEPEFQEETFRVPAILGTRFGFKYIINGIPDGAEIPIIIRKTYPGLKDPRYEKPIFNHAYTQIHTIGEPNGTGYGFDHRWELVCGTWTFQLLYEGKILGEVSFEVYNPQKQ